MMKPTLFIIALALLSACNKAHDGNGGPTGICGTPDDGCPIGIICTMDYKAIFVTLTESGQPMHLDAYKTIRLSDGKEYILQDPGSQQDASSKTNGFYPVLTDSQRKEAARAGSNFEFRGYKNGSLVITERYTIGNDCCHIQLVSGNTTISN